jgi:hypothetical protein
MYMSNAHHVIYNAMALAPGQATWVLASKQECVPNAKENGAMIAAFSDKAGRVLVLRTSTLSRTTFCSDEPSPHVCLSIHPIPNP